MSIVIRKALAEERELIADFSCKLVQFNRKNDPKPHDLKPVLEARRRRAYAYFDPQDESQLFLLAFVDQKPAGFLRARIVETDRAMDVMEPYWGSIEELYVDDRFRGLNLGSRLMDEAFVWLREKKIPTVTLETYAWNQSAGNFYQKKGFKMTDIIWTKEL